MPMMMNRSTLKPEAEFQYGRRQKLEVVITQQRMEVSKLGVEIDFDIPKRV